MEEIDISTYPKEGSLTGQIEWIFEHVKKKKEALYVQGLLTAKYDGSWPDLLYMKDATSSGPQFISIFTRSEMLGKYSNLTSDIPMDIYMEVLQVVNKKLDHVYQAFPFSLFSSNIWRNTCASHDLQCSFFK